MPNPLPLRFAPAASVVWRDPTTLQIGVERVSVILHDVTATEESFVWAVAGGLGDGGVSAVLAHTGGDRLEAESLVDRLQPALEAPHDDRTAEVGVLLAGRGAVRDDIGRLLHAEGLSVVVPDPDDPLAWNAGRAVGVLVGGLALDPGVSSAWTRHDLPHLLVRTGDRSVRVGPLVVPGVTACARCLHLEAGDADRAWPAIAGQLSIRPPHDPRPLVVREAALRAVRRLLSWASTPAVGERSGEASAAHVEGLAADLGLVTRIDLRTGAVTTTSSRPHPDCGCAVLPGTCSADARLLGPDPSGSTRA